MGLSQETYEEPILIRSYLGSGTLRTWLWYKTMADRCNQHPPPVQPYPMLLLLLLLLLVLLLLLLLGAAGGDGGAWCDDGGDDDGSCDSSGRS